MIESIFEIIDQVVYEPAIKNQVKQRKPPYLEAGHDQLVLVIAKKIIAAVGIPLSDIGAPGPAGNHGRV